MFKNVDALPPDPILGITKLFAADTRTEKIDLGLGVYRTREGATPVMQAVQRAQEALISKETTKAYTPPDGAPGFGDGVLKTVFGADSAVLGAERAMAVQTPGGCGALRLAGDLLARHKASSITIGAPTWANHTPLLSAAGLTVNMIPYYDKASASVDFDSFMAGINKLGPTDALLLHGACHNPTGSDLTQVQISTVIDAALERGFLAVVDTAYHGFANSLEEDAYIIREMATRLPELLVTYSCSKNFGLYRERTGALIYVGENAERASAVKSHATNIARANYSMPPAHGGVIVSEILHSAELTELWKTELTEMTAAVKANRRMLVDAAAKTSLGNQLSYIGEQNGMFSLLPMTAEDAAAIRDQYGIYVVGAGRINMCGVNADNVDYLVSSLAEGIAR